MVEQEEAQLGASAIQVRGDRGLDCGGWGSAMGRVVIPWEGEAIGVGCVCGTECPETSRWGAGM